MNLLINVLLQLCIAAILGQVFLVNEIFENMGQTSLSKG